MTWGFIGVVGMLAVLPALMPLASPLSKTGIFYDLVATLLDPRAVGCRMGVAPTSRISRHFALLAPAEQEKTHERISILYFNT